MNITHYRKRRTPKTLTWRGADYILIVLCRKTHTRAKNIKTNQDALLSSDYFSLKERFVILEQSSTSATKILTHLNVKPTLFMKSVYTLYKSYLLYILDKNWAALFWLGGQSSFQGLKNANTSLKWRRFANPFHGKIANHILFWGIFEIILVLQV